MKKRGILIGAVIGLVVLTAGILVIIYLNNPEVLTKAPSGAESGITFETETQPPVLTATQQLIISPTLINEEFLGLAGSCLIVSENYCNKSFILHEVNGDRYAGIGFSDLAVGTKIYAPMDGYLRFYNVKSGENGSNSYILTISNNKDWGMDTPNRASDRVVFFNAVGMRLLSFGSVSSGQAIAELTDSQSINNSRFSERAVLMVSPDVAWHQTLLLPSDNPIDYIKQVAQSVNIQ